MSFTVVVWALIAGIFMGGMISLYSKVYLGRIVRALIKKEAFDKESAVTLKDLGISPTRLTAYSLREGAPLRKHVFAANEDECEIVHTSGKAARLLRKFFTGSENGAKKYDLEKLLLYVPSDKKYSAEAKYESSGNPLIIIPASAVAAAVLAVLAYFGMPKLLELLDSLITTFKNL